MLIEVNWRLSTTIEFGTFPLNFSKDILHNSPTPPDFILLDVMMPKMSGLEVCERVRAKVPQKNYTAKKTDTDTAPT